MPRLGSQFTVLPLLSTVSLGSSPYCQPAISRLDMTQVHSICQFKYSAHVEGQTWKRPWQQSGDGRRTDTATLGFRASSMARNHLNMRIPSNGPARCPWREPLCISWIAWLAHSGPLARTAHTSAWGHGASGILSPAARISPATRTTIVRHRRL